MLDGDKEGLTDQASIYRKLGYLTISTRAVVQVWGMERVYSHFPVPSPLAQAHFAGDRQVRLNSHLERSKANKHTVAA